MSGSLQIGIITALPIEARCLIKNKLSIGQTISLNNNILLHVAGMGAVCAQSAAHSLVTRGVNALMSWGVAGGLAPSIRSGQLILPKQIIDQNNTIFPVDNAWRTQLYQQLENHLSICDGALLQAAAMITSVGDKRKLFQQHQAVAVDMESAAIAAVAQQANLPFIAVRSITDPADFSLPLWMQQSLAISGEVRPGVLIGKLCYRPSRLISLMQMAKDFSAAKSTLTTVANLCGWIGTNNLPDEDEDDIFSFETKS